MNNSGYTAKNLILIFVGIILCIGSLIFVYKFNKYLDTKENNNKINEPTPKKEEPNTNTTSNIDIDFLKLEYNNSENKNIIYSPLSIKYALNMLKDGTVDISNKELTNLLNNTKLNKYNNIENKVALNNALYIRNDFEKEINQDYVKNIKDNYNAEVLFDQILNKERINKWIEDNSLGLMKNALDDINPETILIIVNTLALDLDFQIEFNPSYKGTFNDKQTDMMNQEYEKEKVKYFKEDNKTGISIDLENDYEYIIIMPDNIDEYIKNINVDTLNNDINKLEKNNKKLNLTIPKYKLEYELDFKKDLQTLGVNQIFKSSNADLDKIAEEIYVSKAIHKSNIEVSESGIKASAVTALYLEKNALYEPEEIIYIKIDKPFLYLIKDKTNNDIWFIGTLINYGD